MKKNYITKNNFTTYFDAIIKTKALFKNAALLLLIFFGYATTFGQVTTDAFTTTGAKNWTVPCGVTSITVEAWGAGGAGGGSTVSSVRGGAGGAGGTYVSSTFTVVPGTTYNLFVAPITNGAMLIGAKGQGSWFDTNGVLFAEGGNGGAAPNGGTVAGGLGSTTSSIGTTITVGTNGASGTTTIGGAGGAGANGGGAGGAQRTNGGNGNAGTGPGGGGGGAFVNNGTDRSGGDGARGEIRITYTSVLPANPANPTNDSPKCNPPGVTLTRTGTPPTDVSWYWQTTALGTSTTNSGATYTAATSGTYYIRAQNDVTGCWSIGSGSSVIVITPALTAITGTPNPANNATGICYAGTGSISNISWSAVGGATSYDVYFGAGSLPGSATATVGTTTYNTGTLLASTTYYWKIVPKNACGVSTGSPITWSFTTASAPCYCTTFGGNLSDGITGVNFNTINNLGTTINTPYQDFTAVNTTVIKGFPYNLNVYINTGGNYTNRQSVYIDWNGNGSFADAGEFYDLGTATNVTNGLSSLSPLSITIPAGAITGSVRMRIQSRYNIATTGPCQTGFDGEAEDYTINIIDPSPCAAPTTQPTALILTPNGTTINGNFTAALPAPNSYLIVVNTTGVAPVPTNGTTYTIGSIAFGGTNVVVDNDSNTNFSATSLTPFTTYYFFVYAMNNLCTGGPLYVSTSPLTGNAYTNYCIPSIDVSFQTSTNYHIRKVEFIGTLQDIVNTSSFPTVAPFGYTDYTGLPTKAKQAKGGVVNIYVESPYSGYIKSWVDWNKDGDFNDAGETIYDAGGTSQASTTLGFIVPTSIAAGDYRVRLRISGYNGAGVDAGFNWNACDTNLTYFGETEDYILTVIEDCNAKITSITNGSICGSGTVTLQANATSGTTEFRWYSSQTGGALLATTTVGTWNTPSISSTTIYWVTAYNGSCETLARSKIKAVVKTIPTLTFVSPNIEICGEESVALTAGGDNETIYLIDENFEGGMGVFSNNHIVSNPAVNATTAWQIKTGPYVPTGTTWFPAISSNFGANNFAFVNSDIGTRPCGNGPCYYTINNALVSNPINSTGFIDLTLKFRIYFDRYFPNTIYPADELMQLEVSTNGTAWTTLSGDLINDIGYGGVFSNLSYNLTAYINQPTLRIRIRYFTNTWANGAAVDDIELFGNKPLVPNFTWTSLFPIDAYTNVACTIPYTAGTPVSTVFVKPTLPQLENGIFSFTANSNLTNGCTTSGTITVTNKSKVWKGINGNWNDANNWMPIGIPDATSCVIIPTAPNNCLVGSTNFNGYGKTLQVIDTGKLTINSSNSLTITDFVEVRGTNSAFTIEDSGSLLQINDGVVNKGNIFYKRIAPNIKGSDYVYWSSPVENQNMTTIYDATFPYASGIKYQWNTTLNNGNGTGGNIGQGLWEAASGIMTKARGYIIRGSSNFGMPASNIPTIFNGVPFNGAISYTVQRGAYTGTPYNGANTIQITNLNDNYNLLGNPYPSSINALKFLRRNTYNSSTNPSGVLLGNVKLWRHGIDPMQGVVNPFYGSYQINYDANDYLTINYLGGTEPGPVDIIKSGQAFFVQMIDGPTGSGIVNFNNSMRFDDANLPYNNSGFFKNGNLRTNEISFERNRIWLALTDANNKSSGMLVGYATDATNDYDNLFDAPTGVPSGLKVFSMIENNIDVYEIQGRTLPFDINDEIAVGIVAPTQGNYTFALAGVDGLFDTQNVYIKDTLLNTTHNLKASPYTFTTTSGVNKDRFKIVYVENTLGNPDYSMDNTIKVVTNAEVAVSSSTLQMESIVVYNILGQTLNTYKNINSNYVILSNLHKNNTTLLLKIKLQTGETVTKKIIF